MSGSVFILEIPSSIKLVDFGTARGGVSSSQSGWHEFIGTRPSLGRPSQAPEPHGQSSTGISPQCKKRCVSPSTPQKGHNPSPRLCRLSSSVPDGRRSRSNCQTKFSIFSGMGAFHSGKVHDRDNRSYKAWYAEPTEKIPEGVNRQDMVSE